MKTFIHKDKFHITGRGDVYTINLKENGIGNENGKIDRDKSWEYFPKDEPVYIDGKLWMIVGMESFATFQISDVGLLVKEVE